MKYHKINSVYKRHTEGPLKGQFKDGRDGNLPEFSQDEFRYLYDNPWIGTEKIDGTNIRIYYRNNGYDEPVIEVKGRTDNAQTPSFLQERMDELISSMPLQETFEDREVVLYGEGYGAKIQKVGSSYIPDGVDFILFDVAVGGIFLKRKDVDTIASDLGIKSVPVVFEGTLEKAIEYVKKGFSSVEAMRNPTPAEGLVLTPIGDFLDRRGHRIITKLKVKDYQKG